MLRGASMMQYTCIRCHSSNSSKISSRSALRGDGAQLQFHANGEGSTRTDQGQREHVQHVCLGFSRPCTTSRLKQK